MLRDREQAHTRTRISRGELSLRFHLNCIRGPENSEHQWALIRLTQGHFQFFIQNSKSRIPIIQLLSGTNQSL